MTEQSPTRSAQPGISSKIQTVIRSPWFAILVLNALLVLPSWLHRSATVPRFFSFWYEREIFELFWIGIDLIILVALLYFSREWRHRHLIRRSAAAVFSLLLIFEGYAAIIQQFFQREPVLYNDLFLLTDSIYLFLDLAPVNWLLVLGVTGALFYLFGRFIPAMFHQIQQGFRQTDEPGRYFRAGVVLFLFFIFVLFDWGIMKRDAAAQLVTGRVVQSIRTSAEYHRTVNSVDLDSLTNQYNSLQTINLNRSPHVYFILLESYGKVILKRPELRKKILPALRSLEDTLKKNGWHGASAFSTAPVTGGGSWLSHSTILSGVKIANEPLYDQFIRNDYPTMVTFFKEQGYRTFLLHPADRARPGLSLKNPYNFDEMVTFRDLNYQGKSYGWGIIPDQYSLNFTNEQYLQQSDDPVFLYFTTLATHVIWSDNAIPPLVEDWRMLNKPSETDRKVSEDHPGEGFLFRVKRVFSQPYKPGNFIKLLKYDLDILRDFILNEIPENSIVVIVGDHQPPLLTERGDGTETILSILSTRHQLTDFYAEIGFKPGLIPAHSDQNPFAHQEIYPLLVRGLQHAFSTDSSRTVREEMVKSDSG